MTIGQLLEKLRGLEFRKGSDAVIDWMSVDSAGELDCEFVDDEPTEAQLDAYNTAEPSYTQSDEYLDHVQRHLKR